MSSGYGHRRLSRGAGVRGYYSRYGRSGRSLKRRRGWRGCGGWHPLTGIEIDCKDMPDAIPALAVLGSCAHGKTVLKNITACRMKETDRCKSIVAELTKMGGKFEETPDSLTIYHAPLHGATLNGHHDHRIVMASTCAALVADGETLIDSAEHVGVSFPRFYEEMSKIGANIIRLVEH
ncbi:MAG: hypothetical protein RSC76_06780 [Oscillospiraceae bacterium]